MATFLNLDIKEPVPWKFLIMHFLMSLIWIVGLSIFIFRIDFYFHDYLQGNLLWIKRVIPFCYLLIVLFFMFRTRWYYNLVLLFYPFLVIFWFVPKLILARGKIYLFSKYISDIYVFFKKFKRNIIHFLVFIATIFLISITESITFRIFSMIIMSYFYYRFVFNYIKQSFSPPRLFGTDIEKAIEKYISSPESGIKIIKTIEDFKIDDKLTEADGNSVRLERLIWFSFIIVNFKDNFSGFKGKKAFLISWIYQLIGFFIITLIYFTFINFELFAVNKLNFTTFGAPKLFDFFYYTIKTITFGNITTITPLSIIAKLIEIMSFFTLGIFLLIIVVSSIYSLRQDKISENVKRAADLCIMQNTIIAEHIKNKYQTDIQTVLQESSNIKNSLNNLKKIIESLF